MYGIYIFDPIIQLQVGRARMGFVQGLALINGDVSLLQKHLKYAFTHDSYSMLDREEKVFHKHQRGKVVFGLREIEPEKSCGKVS